MIAVACTSCGARLKADATAGGTIRRCSRCESMVEIPPAPLDGSLSPRPIPARLPAELLPQRQTPWLGYAIATLCGMGGGLAAGLVLFTLLGSSKLQQAQADLVATQARERQAIAQADELRRSLHASIAATKQEREARKSIEQSVADHQRIVMRGNAKEEPTPESRPPDPKNPPRLPRDIRKLTAWKYVGLDSGPWLGLAYRHDSPDGQMRVMDFYTPGGKSSLGNNDLKRRIIIEERPPGGVWTSVLMCDWDVDGTYGVVPYRNGKIHGEQKQWFPDGRLELVRTYVDGVTVGAEKRWYDNGQMQYDVVNGPDGKEISGTLWDVDGSVISP
jgi:hypothetical protein